MVFHHGLGDCANFAHLLRLYAEAGIRVTVVCTSDKRILFEAAGAQVSEEPAGADEHPWYEGELPRERLPDDGWWRWNKPIRNLSASPLPDIGPREQRWRDYVNVRIPASSFVGDSAYALVDDYFRTLAGPVVLLHTHGNTDMARKSLPNEVCPTIYRRLLDAMDGTLVLLDWDDRVPRLPHWRVRHLCDDWLRIDTEQLIALIDRSQLLIGVDSGPLHAARFTETPTIGLWINSGSPAIWSLPRNEQVNLVVGPENISWTTNLRALLAVEEVPQLSDLPAAIATAATRLLARPRYLPREFLAADAQLQHYVLDRLGAETTSIGGYNDRDRSMDRLLREMRARFTRPYVVETGCIRAEDDFAGAGFSTYILGAYLYRSGGQLISVDVDARNCSFATAWTRCFGTTVSIVCSDSVAYLAAGSEAIDVLLLDSLDADTPGAAEHGLREIIAAYPSLRASSIVIYDDTAYRKRTFVGKGAAGVPWLLERGWSILYSGHQTMLARC